MNGKGGRKDLTPEEFVFRAIERLKYPPYKGIHTVFSGFNELFREEFPGLDPVLITSQMAEEGKIVIRPAKRGVILYKADEAPRISVVKEARKKMGID